MKARHLIDEASFGPEALKAIGEAFDAAATTPKRKVLPFVAR